MPMNRPVTLIIVVSLSVLAGCHKLAGRTGPTRATSVAVSITHTCASYDDGSMWCWGENVSGELGDGTTTNQLVPVRVRGVSDVIDVGVGNGVSCAALRSGAVSCWGRASEGGGVQAAPRAVPGINDAIKVMAYDTAACAIRRTGQVACWLPGANATSAFEPVADAVDFAGSGGVRVRDGQTAVPGGLFGPTMYPATIRETFVSTGIGDSSACQLSSAGVVQCNHVSNPGGGELGPVPGVASATAIGLLGRSACAVLRDRSTVCWNATRPASTGAIANASPINQLAEQSSDQAHLCGIRADGKVVCWAEGLSGVGRLGVRPPVSPFEGRVVNVPPSGER